MNNLSNTCPDMTQLEKDIILIANRLNWLNDERIFFRDQGKIDISERFKKQALEAKEKLTFLVNLLDTLKNDSL